MTATVSGLLERVTSVCISFPEVEYDSRTGQHTGFTVRGKTFAWFLVDHHGDGRIALQCKAPPGAQATLVEADPRRYFVPPYVGHRGWVGVDLAASPDWDMVVTLLQDAYRMTAPKRLAARLT
jgi:hypothetical protein